MERAINYGWVCPLCKSVHSPSMMECRYCRQSEEPMFTLFSKRKKKTQLCPYCKGSKQHSNGDPCCACCPSCGGPADNGNTREVPPSPYFCTKCEKEEKNQ